MHTLTGLTSSILASMKPIKLTNLLEKASLLLENARKNELAAAGVFRLLAVLTSSLGLSSISLVVIAYVFVY